MNPFFTKTSFITCLFILVWSASYLQSCKKNPYTDGQALYKQHCANCHMDDGTGLGTLIPPLAGSDFLKNADLGVICIIKHGITGKMLVNEVEYDNIMPANAKLSDVEVANIANYIHNAWGNQREFISLEQVKKILSQCQK